MTPSATLTPKQQAAVDKGDGVFLMEAPPGAGKTEVLVRRILRLLSDSAGANFRVLALTHTTRAAEAITRRITADLDEEGRRLTADTIHAFCRTLLRNYGRPVGVEPDFSVIATADERRAALGTALEDLGVAPGAIHLNTANDLLRRLDDLRVVDSPVELAQQQSVGGYSSAELLAAYDAVLDQWNSLDFPALIWRAHKLLQTESWTRNHVRRMHRYVLLDEAQDCTPTQFAVIELMLGDTPNLFVVASEQQSIYAFGGADPRAVLGRIRKRYSPTLLNLTSNFRSAARIIEHANHLADHLLGEAVLKMEHTGTATGSVAGWQAHDEAQEARLVAHWASTIVAQGLNPDELEPNEETSIREPEIAILARTRWGLEPVKNELGALGHEVVERVSEDGAVTSNLGIAIHCVLSSLANPLNPTARTRLCSLVSEISDTEDVADHDLDQLLAAASAAPSLDLIDTYTNLGDVEALVADLLDLRPSDDDPEPQAWWQERDELRACWHTYSARTAATDRTLVGFLTQMTRLREASLDQSGIRLLTLHAAKGAEFKAVAVMGLNQGTVPYYRSMGSEQEVNDERQAFYVAITRASRTLLVTRSETRLTQADRVQRPPPSRFLKEMELEMTRMTEF